MAPAPSAADMQRMIDLLKNPNIEIDLDNFEWEQHGIAGNGGQAESNAEHPRDSDKDSDNEPDKDSDNESDGDSDSDSEFDDDKYWPKLGSDSDSVNEPGQDLRRKMRTLQSGSRRFRMRKYRRLRQRRRFRMRKYRHLRQRQRLR